MNVYLLCFQCSTRGSWLYAFLINPTYYPDSATETLACVEKSEVHKCLLICQHPRKSTLNIHWKDWCWSWSFYTLATWYKEPTHWKRPWCWERLRGEKGVTADEMVGWYHRLNEHEFKETLGNSEGQGRGHGVLQSMGSQSQTQLSDLTMNNAYIKRLSWRLCLI